MLKWSYSVDFSLAYPSWDNTKRVAIVTIVSIMSFNHDIRQPNFSVKTYWVSNKESNRVLLFSDVIVLSFDVKWNC